MPVWGCKAGISWVQCCWLISWNLPLKLRLLKMGLSHGNLLGRLLLPGQLLGGLLHAERLLGLLGLLRLLNRSPGKGPPENNRGLLHAEWLLGLLNHSRRRAPPNGNRGQLELNRLLGHRLLGLLLRR